MGEIQHIHGGNLREAAGKYGLKTDDILDFSANINPLGPSESALQAIKENLNQIIHYPDPDCTQLRGILSKDLDVSTDNIIMGNGAVELVFLLSALIKPKTVLIPAPTFSEYEIAVRAAGSKVNFFRLKPEDDFRLNVDQLINQQSGIDMLFICNPNNPTGHLLKKKEVLKIIEAGQQTNTFVVIDEAFVDFLPERDQYSVVEYIKEYSNIFILYSLTKFFAIPGLRLGAGVGSNELVSKIKTIKDPWNVNSLAQIAGEISLQDMEYRIKTIEFVQKEKDFLFDELLKIKGLKPFPPTVNYIFIDITEYAHDSTTLKDLMAKKGILIRDCSSYFNLDQRYIRVAVKDRKANIKIIETFRDLA